MLSISHKIRHKKETTDISSALQRYAKKAVWYLYTRMH